MNLFDGLLAPHDVSAEQAKHCIFKDSKLLVPVVCFTELV